jgi:hypothetical protein
LSTGGAGRRRQDAPRLLCLSYQSSYQNVRTMAVVARTFERSMHAFMHVSIFALELSFM